MLGKIPDTVFVSVFTLRKALDAAGMMMRNDKKTGMIIRIDQSMYSLIKAFISDIG